MVREVQAFAADDGTVFPTHGEAAKHDAQLKLKQIGRENGGAGTFNHPTIMAIIANAPAIADALNSLLDEPEA